LAKQGWQVVAVDHQAPTLACAADLALAEQVSVDFRLADLSETQQRPTEFFDVIYQLRFLDRNLFDYIEAQLNPGGFVLIETFAEGVQAFGSPKNPKFILQPGELAQRFAHFDIIVDKLGTLPDGRPMNAFLARKPPK
jgi:2-polyprenyl-3-methyl-5-hydroxy-6-metoxy-1,4-benzoquinol methylase